MDQSVSPKSWTGCKPLFDAIQQIEIDFQFGMMIRIVKAVFCFDIVSEITHFGRSNGCLTICIHAMGFELKFNQLKF